MAIFGFDPPECIRARQCLAQGLLAEAAQVLLGAKDRHHRRVQELLAEVGIRLIEEAKKLYESEVGIRFIGEGAKFYESFEQLEAAAQLLRLANQCIQLDGHALVLKQQIEHQLYERQQAHAWRKEQLHRARHLMEMGHLHTAEDLLTLFQEDREAAQLRAEIQAKADAFRRHLEAIQQFLACRQPEAAYRHWQDAQKICPHDPELRQLAQEIAQQMAAAQASVSAGSPLNSASGRLVESLRVQALSQRSQAFLLGEWALVLSSAQICIGSPRGPDVQIPLLGRLHQRHVLLWRDSQGWQIMPLHDQNGTACSVWLNGVLILGPQRMRDGDQITIGRPGKGSEGNWRFRLPVSGSHTAVLETGAGNPNLIYMASHRLAKAVLVADSLLISSHPPAHLVVPDLPCQRIVLHWKPEGLCWQVEGGLGRLEIPGQSLDQADSRLYLPSRLVIDRAMEEAELLGRAAAGAAPCPQMCVEIKEVPVG